MKHFDTERENGVPTKIKVALVLLLNVPYFLFFVLIARTVAVFFLIPLGVLYRKNGTIRHPTAKESPSSGRVLKRRHLFGIFETEYSSYEFLLSFVPSLVSTDAVKPTVLVCCLKIC